MIFDDRDDAGRQLGAALQHLRDDDVVVLGLPRGGVPVAARVATALNAPLDVIIVRKLGLPGQPELAFGAVGEDGVTVLNEEIVRLGGLSTRTVERVVEQQRHQVAQRAERLRRAGPITLTGKTAVIVDDGIATGASARAACQVARAHGATRIIMAAPVGAPDTVASLQEVADQVVCLAAPSYFQSVGQFYEDFAQVPDSDVVRLLGAQ